MGIADYEEHSGHKMSAEEHADLTQSHNKSDPIISSSFKLPLVMPFETQHTQVFPEYVQYKGAFSNSLLATKDGNVKQLEYVLDYEFTPEVKHRGKKPNDPAMITVHLLARVTDLVATDGEPK